MSKKIALIDGYGFVFRAYHSLPPLTRNDGTPVGAVFGFTNMLIKLLASLDVSHVAVVFDAGSKTFRNDIYPAYKANRPPCPEELIPQFPIVREAAESLNLTILEKAGFEADDIIATLAKEYSANNDTVLIISSDKDLMQLIDANVSMYDAMKNRMITEKEVIEKFNVAPNRVLDMLALMGDAADNIPGVKGIGPKTAAELINQFGSLEGIFENLDQIKQNKRRELLTDGVDNAKLSKTLAALKDDVALGITIDDLALRNIEPEKLINFLNFQGFRSLVVRVQKEFGVTASSSDTKPSKADSKPQESTTKSIPSLPFAQVTKTKITSQATLDEIEKMAARNGLITIDYQKNLNDGALELVTLSTSKINESPTQIFYFTVGDETPESLNAQEDSNPLDLFSFAEKPAEKPTEKNIKPSCEGSLPLHCLNAILDNNAIKKILFHAKEFLKVVPHQSHAITYEDVALMNHLTTSSIKNSLFEIIEVTLDENLSELGFDTIFTELEKAQQGKKCNLEALEDETQKIDFFTFQNFALSRIYRIFAPKIFDLRLNFAYQTFERPLLAVLAKMENAGIKVDVATLKNLSDEFATKLQSLTKDIHAIAGEEFNIASTQQLANILFEKLELASSKKSKKTGAFSTKSSVLEELAFEGHAIASKVLEFRKFSKLKNTYTDALPKEINPKTGRVHSHFSTTATVTGRFNSSNPNLQNIPIRSTEGRKIRTAFVAKDGHLLISADYSQIELRVIAHVAKIGTLIQAFKDGKDIHKITASQVMGIKEEDVDDKMRSSAKAINFGIVYGISAFGLAKQLGISRQDAGAYIKSYLAAYPGIETFMHESKEFAKEHGFVKTLSGRKCFIHDINHANHMVKSEAERLAINAPIQGSAADVIKKAMIRLDHAFHEQGLKSKVILQIHDELIVEAPENEVELATKILKSEMENAMMLDVPLKVDVSVSKSWS